MLLHMIESPFPVHLLLCCITNGKRFVRLNEMYGFCSYACYINDRLPVDLTTVTWLYLKYYWQLIHNYDLFTLIRMNRISYLATTFWEQYCIGQNDIESVYRLFCFCNRNRGFFTRDNCRRKLQRLRFIIRNIINKYLAKI